MLFFFKVWSFKAGDCRWYVDKKRTTAAAAAAEDHILKRTVLPSFQGGVTKPPSMDPLTTLGTADSMSLGESAQASS